MLQCHFEALAVRPTVFRECGAGIPQFADQYFVSDRRESARLEKEGTEVGRR
jgi:hypothetical protein